MTCSIYISISKLGLCHIYAFGSLLRHKMRGGNTYLLRLLQDLTTNCLQTASLSAWPSLEKHSLYGGVLCCMRTSEDTRMLCIINVGITCMPISGNMRVFFFYFDFKGLIPYLCFNNNLLVRSMKYLIPHSGSGNNPNDIIFPVRKIDFNMLYLSICCAKSKLLFFLEFNAEMVFNHW